MFFIFLIFFIGILDQASKFYIVLRLDEGSSIPIIKGIFHLTHVHNTGAAFGIFKGYSYFFISITVLFLLFFGYMLILRIFRRSYMPGLSGDIDSAVQGKSKKKYFMDISLRDFNFSETIALSFIIAGTIGNLIDRIRFGYVIDFIDFRVWPVFNIADSFITIGAVILMASFLRKKG
ncbi:MAG: signal peptidase II [Candidatus Omnitrophota bacterium]